MSERGEHFSCSSILEAGRSSSKVAGKNENLNWGKEGRESNKRGVFLQFGGSSPASGKRKGIRRRKARRKNTEGELLMPLWVLASCLAHSGPPCQQQRLG